MSQVHDVKGHIALTNRLRIRRPVRPATLVAELGKDVGVEPGS